MEQLSAVIQLNGTGKHVGRVVRHANNPPSSLPTMKKASLISPYFYVPFFGTQLVRADVAVFISHQCVHPEKAVGM